MVELSKKRRCLKSVTSSSQPKLKVDIDNAEQYFEHLVRLKSSHEKTLIDLGCGDGFFTAKVAPFNKKVIGIESAWTFHTAKQRTANPVCANLHFRQENAFCTSVETASTDLVISRYGPVPETEVFRAPL